MYGWTPEEINRLTIYQVAFYLGVPVPEMGRMRMRLDEAAAWFGPQFLRRTADRHGR